MKSSLDNTDRLDIIWIDPDDEDLRVDDEAWISCNPCITIGNTGEMPPGNYSNDKKNKHG